MKEILIISNYYPPEKGAAANRIEQLAVGLNNKGFSVRVVCPLANYPEGKLFSGYKNRWRKQENLKGVDVLRLWIYPSVSKNPLKRILSTLSFSIGLFAYLLFGKLPYKVVLQSPPLLLSFLSTIALKIRQRAVILNISDLWPMAALELGVMRKNSLSHRVLGFMERFIYRNAATILGQSDEIITHIKNLAPQKKCFLYRNLPQEIAASVSQQNGLAPVKIFYAGLLGVAQGVYQSCNKIKWHELTLEFHIFGDGAEKQVILNYVKQEKKNGLFFHGMIPRESLHEELESMDVAFVPLTKRIYGTVPSKIFEYAARGIPILYFGGGEGEEIVKMYKLGWVVPVGDYDALQACLSNISKMSRADFKIMRENILKQATTHFNLDQQIQNLLDESVF
jgi:glycosyltransferase involved in cell wall biosynthesis